MKHIPRWLLVFLAQGSARCRVFLLVNDTNRRRTPGVQPDCGFSSQTVSCIRDGTPQLSSICSLNLPPHSFLILWDGEELKIREPVSDTLEIVEGGTFLTLCFSKT